MAVIGQWRDFKFEISPSVILGFNDLQIKTTRETDAVDSKSQQYVKTKHFKPLEITLTVHLHAGLGYDVQTKVEAFRGAPLYGDGRADYFYIGGKKLLPCKLSVTEATVSRVEINAGGVWTAADVALTFKQAALLDGTQTTQTSTGTGGGKKQTVTPTKTTTTKTVASALTTGTKKAVSKAVSTIKQITTTAKKTTATKKAAGAAGSKAVMMVK